MCPVGELADLVGDGRPERCGKIVADAGKDHQAATGSLPGPNAIAFLEHTLAALKDIELTGPAKLETIAIFSGAVRLFAQTEIDQQRTGQDATQWQSSLATYLLQVTAAGQHPAS